MLVDFIYILPMILGRTFDARYDRVGIDIFSQSELDRKKILHEPRVSSFYKIIDSSDSVRDLLKISGDLSLKVKAGKVDLKGTGTYLKDSSKSERTVEILTRLKYETITESLPPNAVPFVGWNLQRSEDLGTHYVESITYGGELVASVKFRANKDSDFNSINGMVKGIFSGGGSIDGIVGEGKLEHIQSKLQDKATMEISFYANVPLKGVPHTIEGLRTLVKGFETHVTEVNKGMGVPIRVQLAEISSIGGKEQFLKNSDLEAELTNFEMEFDDLTSSLAKLTTWYRSLPVSINLDQEKKISSLYQRISTISREYYKAIGNMNVEIGGVQLQPARVAYEEKRRSPPGKFAKELSRLIKDTVTHERNVYATGTSTYIRWGSTECPLTSPMISEIDVGYMSISTHRGIGGGSQYLCLPSDPENEPSFPSYGSVSSTLVSGVRYGVMETNVFGPTVQGFFGHGVPCARCHITNRTLVYNFPAADECPPGWITEYSGALVSGSNLHGTHICLDGNPQSYSRETEEQNSHILGVVHVNNEDFPLSTYDENMAFKCIVCSK